MSESVYCDVDNENAMYSSKTNAASGPILADTMVNGNSGLADISSYPLA